MHLYAGPIIFKNANSLRRNPTKAEEILWTYLRDRQMEGVKFRRQHPIKRFVADLYAHEVKLIIELDGDVHLLPDHIEYDLQRSEILNNSGITILRFGNKEIYEAISQVLETIRHKIVLLRNNKK